MELQEFTQRLGEAFEGMEGFALAAWVPDHCGECGGSGEIYQMRKNNYRGCKRCHRTGLDPEHKMLSHRSPSNRNLAELLGLNHEKMEAERDAVLKHVQAEASG